MNKSDVLNIIQHAYEGILNREADKESLDYYSALILDKTISFKDLYKLFTSYDEFYERCSPINVEQAISNIYSISNNNIGNSCIWNESSSKLIFCHFPKTGGMSINTKISKYFHPLQLDNKLNSDYKKFYSGHFNFKDLNSIQKPYKIFTCLRNPKNRLISLFNFFNQISPEVSPWDKPANAAKISQKDFFSSL